MEQPQFRDLDRSEIEEILSRNHLGRIAYSRDNRIHIQPVHFVYSDGWLYGRTSYGAKYGALGETAFNWWPVAFEVEEVEGPYDWRSVVLHGGFYIIPQDGADWERETWEKAVDLLRTVAPLTLREGDPTPFRSVLFRIHAQEVTGKEATTRPPTG